MQTCFHPTAVFADAVPPNELDRHLTAYQALSTFCPAIYSERTGKRRDRHPTYPAPDSRVPVGSPEKAGCNRMGGLVAASSHQFPASLDEIR